MLFMIIITYNVCSVYVHIAKAYIFVSNKRAFNWQPSGYKVCTWRTCTLPWDYKIGTT